MACCWHVLIDVGFCSDFLFTWLVSSIFFFMLAFAVFFPLYGLLLASSHGCWLLLCFSSLHGLLLVTLCLIYSSICEIFMCGFSQHLLTAVVEVISLGRPHVLQRLFQL